MDSTRRLLEAISALQEELARTVLPERTGARSDGQLVCILRTAMEEAVSESNPEQAARVSATIISIVEDLVLAGLLDPVDLRETAALARDLVARQDHRSPGRVRLPRSARLLNLLGYLAAANRAASAEDIVGSVEGYSDRATHLSLLRRFERDKKVLCDVGLPIHIEAGEMGPCYSIVAFSQPEDMPQ